MNSSRNEHRDGVGVPTPEPCESEGQQGSRVATACQQGSRVAAVDQQGSRDVAVFERLLNQLLSKCQAAPDYLTASFVFNTSVRGLRAFGCPESLIDDYDLRLSTFFGRKNEVTGAARDIVELFMDNHGNINNNKE